MNTREFANLCCVGHPALTRSSDAGALSEESRQTLQGFGSTVAAVGFGGFLGFMLGGKTKAALVGAAAGYGVLTLVRLNAELSRDPPPAAA